MRSRPDRIPCEVFGCRRTADAKKYAPNTIIICAKCWRLGDKRDRRIFSRCARLLKIGKEKTARGRNLRWLKTAAFRRIVKKAMERRVGITA